jgi:GntR family transcriptional regulator
VRARFAEVAQQLERDITSGVFPLGVALPSETQLAAHYGVARGTLRRALDEIASGSRLLSHRGRAWFPHRPAASQSFEVLRSFGQWALAAGLSPSGVTVRSARGRATALESRELGIRRGDAVLRITRVQSLDDRPVMIKRTTFPDQVADIVSALPVDARSIMEVVQDEHGIVLGHAEHRVDAIAADIHDSRLLGVRRGSPLLRARRTVRTRDGMPFEYSDDRYDSASVTFSFVNT